MISISNINTQPALTTVAPEKRLNIYNRINYSTNQYYYSREVMQSLLTKINATKSFIIADLNGVPLPEIIGSVTIPSEHTVVANTAGLYINGQYDGDIITGIELYYIPSASLNQFSANFDLPLYNTEITPVSQSKQSEYYFQKNYSAGCQFIFPDNEVITLSIPAQYWFDPLLTLIEQKQGAYLTVDAPVLAALGLLSPNDELDLVIGGTSSTGFGGIVTPMNTPYNLTYQNSVVNSNFSMPGGNIDMQGYMIELSGTLGSVNIGQALASYPMGTEFTLTLTHPTLGTFSTTRPLSWANANENGVIIYNQYSDQANIDANNWVQLKNSFSYDQNGDYTLRDYTVTFSIAAQNIPGGPFSYELNDLIVKSPGYATSESEFAGRIINLINTPSISIASSAAYQAAVDHAPNGPWSMQVIKTAGTGGGGGSGGSGGSGGEGSGGGSGGSGGGGGSSTTPVSGAVVVGGKAVGTVSVDPRTTPVRVTIAGVEQALPEGSVVRNTLTGQKFLKVAGGEMAFAAISVTPPAEWSWSAAGAQGWSVLQGF